jgi:hypothetical protein
MINELGYSCDFTGSGPAQFEQGAEILSAFAICSNTAMAFKGRDPIRSKIIIDNKIIKQVNSFSCLGNLIPCYN